MLTADKIAHAIVPLMPAEHREHGTTLAHLLADLAAGTRSQEEARVEVSQNPALAMALGSLGGQQVASGSAVLDFGGGNQLGDVRVRDVAGGNIITISLPAQPPQRQQIDEKRTYGCLGLPIFSITSSRTIITLALMIVFSGAMLGGLIAQSAFLHPGNAQATSMPIGTSVVIIETQIPTEVVSAPTDTPVATKRPQLTPVARPKLRVRLLNYNDAPSCISMGITGINVTGWRLGVNGLDLAAIFDRGGNARVCGLGSGQEVTISIVDQGGQVMPGGGGIPARGGAILSGVWR